MNVPRLYFRMQGRGEPIVYVHGGFASLERWLTSTTSADAPWKRALAEHHSLISYDRRGCEHSPVTAGGYDPVTQAGDLIALVESRGPVHVVASSAGGPVAVVAAARRPDLVRSLTVQGSSLRVLPHHDVVANTARAAVAVLAAAGAETAFHQRPSGVEISLDGPWSQAQAEADGRLTDYLATQHVLTARAELLATPIRVERYVAEVRNLAAYVDVDVTAWAARVTAPTLVLHGSNDRLFGLDKGRELAASITGARFEIVDGAGHTPIFTNDEALDRTRDFLAAHAANSTRSRT